MQSQTSDGTAGIIGNLMKLIATHQQTLKWIVYALLLVNFFYYIYDDMRAAQVTLGADASLLDFMKDFATSIDELGWFFILFLLEVETYWMEDDEYGPLYWGVQITRVACYGLICHTLYAYITTLIELGDVVQMAGVTNVCEVVGQDLSFLRNLLYDEVTAENCAMLSNASEFYIYPKEPVVTDLAGFQEAVRHAWIDVIDVVCWLTVSLSMTFVIQLQDRKIYDSVWITRADRAQIICYVILVGEAVYWLYHGYYVYTWDTLLWIGGFAGIDANLVEWRDDLKEEQGR
ncbi:MAG: hypothetical protein P8J14_04255 [Emcibacteraceae bacterium]|nr:hypothetical protein [Emcibacteraceae bacterium]